MGIAVLAAALAAAVATAVTWFILSRRARAADRSAQTALADVRDLTQRLAAVEAERAATATERDDLVRARDRLATERDGAWEALGEERQRRERVEAEVAELRDSASRAPRPHQEADGCWALLLADVERRWAAVAGVPQDVRGVHLGAVPDQLSQALTREVERLREEVGVDISLTTESGIEPTDPVVFLLAATHLLGVLAAGCQQVTVTLDGGLEVAGDGWAGSHDELEEVRERALAAGAAVDPLNVVVEERASEGDEPDSEPREHVQVSVALRGGPGPG